MNADEEDAGLAKEFLTFVIGEERYAIPVTSVEVVLEMATITRVPKSPPQLRGVLNHRGTVIPVMDLRIIFGMEPSRLAPDESIVVAQFRFEDELLTAGILTDSVQEVVELDQSQIEQAPSFGSRVNSDFILGIAKHQETFIILLDLERAIATSMSNGKD